MKRVRKSATFTTTINPAILRAFRRAEKRRCRPDGKLKGRGLVGGQQGLLERLIVCYLRSDPWTRQKLIEAYGDKHGPNIGYAEAFEVSEYGRVPSREEVRKLFPFFPER